MFYLLCLPHHLLRYANVAATLVARARPGCYACADGYQSMEDRHLSCMTCTYKNLDPVIYALRQYRTRLFTFACRCHLCGNCGTMEDLWHYPCWTTVSVMLM
jgi:hypothetical protein